MKKWLSLFSLCLVLLVTQLHPTFATSAVPQNILFLIDQLNFSNPANDRSPTLIPWINQSSMPKDFKESLLNFNAGNQQNSAYLPSQNYLSQRKVVSPWTPVGKPDLKLGQAYLSQVDICFGQVSWEQYGIQTQLWVKQVGSQTFVTKVLYQIVPLSDSRIFNTYILKNTPLISRNVYLNLANAYSYFNHFGTPYYSTNFGLEVTALNDYILKGVLFSSGNSKQLTTGQFYPIELMTSKQDMVIITQTNLAGFNEKTLRYREVLLDSKTKEPMPFENGWALKRDQTYIHGFILEQFEPDANSSDHFYLTTTYALSN